MTKRLLATFLISFLVACSPLPQYEWQDTRTPPRDDVTSDLESCRAYAARQYKPGTPAGEEYLKPQGDEMSGSDVTTQGEWRPDRSPGTNVSVHSLPRHDIPVSYTGYPGELDYYPHYLDDILEKCMRDRGWEYSEVRSRQ